eukprot:jgi/Tetstr1/454131/TSEL_041050.t1
MISVAVTTSTIPDEHGTSTRDPGWAAASLSRTFASAFLRRAGGAGAEPRGGPAPRAAAEGLNEKSRRMARGSIAGGRDRGPFGTTRLEKSRLGDARA